MLLEKLVKQLILQELRTKWFTFVFLVFSLQLVNAQNSFVLLQIVAKDSATHEPIADCQVFYENTQTISNKNGVIKVAITPVVLHKIIIQSNEHLPYIINYQASTDSSVIVFLKPKIESIQIGRIDIFANSNTDIENTQTGFKVIQSKDIKLKPALGGIEDVLKSFQKEPGIVSIYEGSTDIYIRGGAPEQNLYLINDIPLQRSSMLHGFVSLYDPLLIGKTELIKSGFSAEYGSRVSAVVSATTDSIDLNSIKSTVELGLLQSKIIFEAPILKEKIGFRLFSSFNYADKWSFASSTMPNTSKFNASNHALELNYKYSAKQSFDVLYYGMVDNNTMTLSLSESDSNFVNQNSIQHLLGGRWHYISNKLSNKLSIGYTNNSYVGTEMVKQPSYSLSTQQTTETNNLYLKNKIQYKVSNKLNLCVGLTGTHSKLNPFNLASSNDALTLHYSTGDLWINETALYSSSIWTPLDFVTVKVGVRGSRWQTEQISLKSIEPRLAMRLLIKKNIALKLDYSEMTQPVHVLYNRGLNFGNMVSIPSSEGLEQQKSQLYSSKLVMSAKNSNFNYNIAVSSYFKSIKNVLEYIDGYNLNSLINDKEISSIADVLVQGNQETYGVELETEFSSQKWFVGGNYTLSRSVNTFLGLNNSKSYFSNSDRPHVINLFYNREIHDIFNINLSWQYASGRPYTVPDFWYITPLLMENGEQTDNLSPIWSFKQRNAKRMKANHSLNISFVIKFKENYYFAHSLKIGVSNLYNRKNPYTYIQKIEYSNGINNNTLINLKTYSVSLFPILPFLNYRISF